MTISSLQKQGDEKGNKQNMKSNNNLYYTGTSSYCQLTNYSCRKLGVPVG